MSCLEILQIPILTDNYAHVIRCRDSGACAAVDPGESGPVRAALEARGWRLDRILNTHHHRDHVGGNLALREATGAHITGPRAERDRIPGIDDAVGAGDEVLVGRARARVFDTPGHTGGHIAYWFERDAALFSGDTLFGLSCGRLFEGTPAQMWASLDRFRALPGETRIYCGHEYTRAGLPFALSVDGGNPDLTARAARIGAARAGPTVPLTLAEELATNPFLRADDPALAARLGLDGADPTAVFAELRRRKDAF